jgi:hypothetical protein
METHMSRYPYPDLKDLPEDMRTKILDVQEKAGFVPMFFWRWQDAPPNGARFLITTTR